MAFLRTLFWIVLTVVVVVFSIRNWIPVTISLFGNIDADVKLPVLLLIAFLIGFVPLYIWHHAFKWRHARKLALIGRASPVGVSAPMPSSVQNPPSVAAPDPFQAD